MFNFCTFRKVQYNVNIRKYHWKDVGKMLDKFKKEFSIPHDAHGKITIDGRYIDSTGRDWGYFIEF
jgi:hypothetical protein